MNRPGSSLQKAKNNKIGSNYGIVQKKKEKVMQFEDYLKNRDWVGAVNYLENNLGFGQKNIDSQVWMAYCCFHNGEYRKAISTYEDLLKSNPNSKEYYLYKACCYYALTQYDDAKREALKGPENQLQNRLLFHIAHKKQDEKHLVTCHQKVTESTQDQLSLAAIHFLRGHYEEATGIYKKILLENREYIAINLYIALSYFKMDLFDVSTDILNIYLQSNPNSIIANNLKACNQFQLYSGDTAEASLKHLQKAYESGRDVFADNDLLSHNLVVFRNGENALKVFPPLAEYFPEAKLNLIIYYLNNEKTEQAFELAKEIEPSVPREYIIKGICYAMQGQAQGNDEYLKEAQRFYQTVGSSASECDTINGRQSMASCFFILQQFEDVLVYLSSIKQYFTTDNTFLWNYGIAKCQVGEYKEAEESLLQVKKEEYRAEVTYNKFLCKCFIMNGKPAQAWEIYTDMDQQEQFEILSLIGNDCYRMGFFYYSYKAFDLLIKLDQDGDYEDALKGSVVGVFQQVIAQKESQENLEEVIGLLKQNANTPEIEYILKVIRKWGKENGMEID